MASWIWELHFLGLWHGLAGEVLQLDAAQRSSAHHRRHQPHHRCSALSHFHSAALRQQQCTDRQPTATAASACQASLFSASARQSLLRRSARSRSRSTISISILIHPLTHSPTHPLAHSLNLPALLCAPRTLILLQGLASSFVTSASARFSPFSARPPGSIAPPRPDLIALTCSSDCTCTSTRADCPAPACTTIYRSRQTPLPCRAVLPSYRAAPCLTHRHRHLTLIPGPCIQPNHAPTISTHTRRTASSSSRAPRSCLGFLIRLSFNPPIQLATIRPSSFLHLHHNLLFSNHHPLLLPPQTFT